MPDGEPQNAANGAESSSSRYVLGYSKDREGQVVRYLSQVPARLAKRDTTSLPFCGAANLAANRFTILTVCHAGVYDFVAVYMPAFGTLVAANLGYGRSL